MNAEILELRAVEAAIEEMATEGDRLARDLVSVYACDFVVIEGMPPGSWAVLPEKGGGQVTWEMLRWGRLPRGQKGRVGVSMEMLRSLAARSAA